MPARRKKPQPILMPDLTDGGVGMMTIAGGGALHGGAFKIGVVLNFEVRTGKSTALVDVTLPECFERDRDRFEDGFQLGKHAGMELKQDRSIRGKLTLTQVHPTDGTETVIGYLPGMLARQTLVCDEAGKARCVYRFEFELEPDELSIIGRILLMSRVQVQFEASQPNIPLHQATDLEGEA